MSGRKQLFGFRCAVTGRVKLSQMGFSYSVFGLAIQSNIPIPGLSPVEINLREHQPRGPSVRVRLSAAPNTGREDYRGNREPFYVSSYLAPSGSARSSSRNP